MKQKKPPGSRYVGKAYRAMGQLYLNVWDLRVPNALSGREYLLHSTILVEHRPFLVIDTFFHVYNGTPTDYLTVLITTPSGESIVRYLSLNGFRHSRKTGRIAKVRT